MNIVPSHNNVQINKEYYFYEITLLLLYPTKNYYKHFYFYLASVINYVDVAIGV